METRPSFRRYLFSAFLAAALLYASLMPDSFKSALAINNQHSTIHALAHFATFVLFGAVFASAPKSGRGRLLALAASLSLACGLEVLEASGRPALVELNDIHSNAFGCVVGFLIAAIISRRQQRVGL